LELFRGTNGVTHIHSDEDWFDVHDIEGYLFSEGIGLDEYPSPLSSIPSIEETGTLALTGSVPGTMMVIDEYKLINSMSSSGLAFLLIRLDLLTLLGLSRLPVGLGCVAGFRRSDVERVVFQNVRWINTPTMSPTG
jgi:hypothetical protein